MRSKVSTGYGRLDEALQGGFFVGSAVLLSAPASSEVPILVRNFLKASDDVGLLICRSQSSAEAVSQPDDKNLKCLICSGKPISPSRNLLPGKGIDNLTELNFQLTETIGSVQPKRVALEILSDILLRHKALQTRKWLGEFLQKLRSKGITTLTVFNPYMHPSEEVHAVVDLFDGNLEIFEKEVEGSRRKFLHVKWMHGVKVAEKEFPPIDLAPEPQTSSRQVTSLDTKRIAILPFVNISPDPNDAYFADGLTEELISTTSSIASLTLIARTSVMGYKGTTKKIEDIGKELSVGTVLEGSVRKAGNRLRITTQLIDVQSQGHLWAESYDRELDDIFKIQSDIASKIAEALKVKLLANEANRIEKKPTDSAGAYLLYLKGRQHWNRRSEASVRKAIEYFDFAVYHDQKFALAYVGLADCYNILCNRHYMERSEAAEKAGPAISKALQLDEKSADAHATYGWFLMDNDWNWDAAEAEYKRAIELNPNYATAHQWYSGLLQIEGRLEEALAEAKSALELDPLAPIISVAVANTLCCLERYDDAIEYYNKALAIEPNFVPALSSLPAVYAIKEEFDEALARQQKLARTDYPKGLAMASLAAIQARAGKKDESLNSLDSAMKLQDQEKIPAYGVASIFAALHDENRAFEWLEKALMQRESGSGSVADIKADPWFKELRTRPRFLEILKKLGLDKY